MSKEGGQFIGQGIAEADKPFRNGLVNFEDPKLRALRFLLLDKQGRDYFKREDIEHIAQAAVADPARIQLVDFVDQIGLPEEVVDDIRQQQYALMPDVRKQAFVGMYRRAVRIIPSIPEDISRARMNPFTEFENQPPLLFGMGGGSRALNKGFPIDILSMVLTAEKLRRSLDLGRCRIICANQITYTNIPNNPSEFSKESIDGVLSTERDLLKLVVERLGIADHFDIFLESDIKQIIGRDLKDQYDQIVEDADTVPFIGGHHYAMEMAQMYTLVNQEKGGVKLGWYMRPLNTVRPEYIMDEQPFDARYTLYLAHRGLTNRVSIPYARAGVKLRPSETGIVNKEPPYICYDPSDRILLSPFEDPERKLSEATRVGGGVRLREIRRHFGTIAKLFEEIVLGEDVLPVPVAPDVGGLSVKERRATHAQSREQGRPTQLIKRVREIDDEILEDSERFDHNSSNSTRESKIGRRLQYILDYIFDGNRGQTERMYKEAFPKAHDYK